MPVLCEKDGERIKITIFDRYGATRIRARIDMPYSAYVGANSEYVCYKLGDEFIIQNYKSEVITRTAASDIFLSEMNESFCVIAMNDSDIKYFNFLTGLWRTIPHAASSINLTEEYILTFISDSTDRIITFNLSGANNILSEELKTECRGIQVFIDVNWRPRINCLKCLKDEIDNVIFCTCHVFCTKDPNTGLIQFFTFIMCGVDLLFETLSDCDLNALEFGFIKMTESKKYHKIYDVGYNFIIQTDVDGLFIIKK